MADPMTGLITGLVGPLMVAGARTVLVDVLVMLALVVLVVTAMGMTIGRSRLTRLHFLAPAGTLALPLFGLAAVISQGLTLGSTAIALAVIAGALSSPVLTTSIARLVAAEDADVEDGDDEAHDAVIDDHRAGEQR